jgi:hypothetical protein
MKFMSILQIKISGQPRHQPPKLGPVVLVSATCIFLRFELVSFVNFLLIRITWQSSTPQLDFILQFQNLLPGPACSIEGLFTWKKSQKLLQDVHSKQWRAHSMEPSPPCKSPAAILCRIATNFRRIGLITQVWKSSNHNDPLRWSWWVLISKKKRFSSAS